MAVYKVIFRLDFEGPNFDIVDGPGSVMRVLSEMGENYWAEFQEMHQQHSVTGISKKGVTIQRFTVEPNALHFTWENGKGLEFSRLELDSHFSNLMKGAKLVCEKFKIHKLARAGIRFTALTSLGKDNKDLNPLFRSLVSDSALLPVIKEIGAIDDYGIKLDGCSEDITKYHISFGPYKVDDFKNLQFQHEKLDELAVNLVFDLDLYEESFALKVSPAVWARSMILKANSFSQSIDRNLTEKLNSI